MMSSPFFSIIIPTYNSEATIECALMSVLKQQFNDWEVLIIDGLSTDNTSGICERFQSEQIKWFSEKDEGIYDAMNKGIARSAGQWLLFLGSDDELYDSTTLLKVSRVIAKNKNTRFVYGDVLTSLGFVQTYRNFTYRKLLDMSICHQSIYYHRSLFSLFQYDLKYKICADWDFNLKIFSNKITPVYLPEPLARYNMDGASHNWRNHPEYLRYFKDTPAALLRYRSHFYLYYFYVADFLYTIKTSVQGKIRRNVREIIKRMKL